MFHFLLKGRFTHKKKSVIIYSSLDNIKVSDRTLIFGIIPLKFILR